jgi:prepilin-type N-terminal cleavage/methylation domain-containing protein
MRTDRGGFTLIELLVVIGIILVLAGLSTAAMWGVSGNKDKLKAKYQIQAIEDAIRRFRFTNNQYPWDLPAGPADPVDIVWEDLCKELNPTNDELNGNAVWNAQLKDYIEFDSRKDISGGVVLDPWGLPYSVYWDRTRDKVVIWSWGQDGEDATFDDAEDAGDGNFGDDITNL